MSTNLDKVTNTTQNFLSNAMSKLKQKAKNIEKSSNEATEDTAFRVEDIIR